MVVSLAGASRLVWPLANSLSSYTHLDEYLHAANCNLMPEKALPTAIGNAKRMKFIESEPQGDTNDARSY